MRDITLDEMPGKLTLDQISQIVRLRLIRRYRRVDEISAAGIEAAREELGLIVQAFPELKP